MLKCSLLFHFQFSPDVSSQPAPHVALQLGRGELRGLHRSADAKKDYADAENRRRNEEESDDGDSDQKEVDDSDDDRGQEAADVNGLAVRDAGEDFLVP